MEAAGIAVVNTAGASDADLVSWARDGDDAAFGELFRRYRPRVAAFVNGIVRDEGRAEDVTQEAFLSALRRLRETDREIAFKPWIFQIARNASIDVYRRGSRTEEVPIDVDGGLPAGEADRLPRHAAPDSSLMHKERFDHLRGALAELSQTHHRIIVLRELEGLSYREIAERMELTPAAVESTLFRARRKLEHEYIQLDTGRRCQSVAALIGRLAEGLESTRDRRRLDRHARRCPACRRRARELGVEPVLARRRPASRIAALLPLPVLLKRREILDLPSQGLGASLQQGAPLQALVGSGLEPATTAGKAVAAVVAAAVIGGGGVTLGGVGPIASAGGEPQAVTHTRTLQPAPAQRETTLLLDQGLGRTLPTPPPPKPRRRSRSAASAPKSQRSAPSRATGGAPAEPVRRAPRLLRKLPAPDVRSAPGAPSDLRSRVRVPPRQGGGAPAIQKVVPGALKAIDVKASVNQATATVSKVLTPPS